DEAVVNEIDLEAAGRDRIRAHFERARIDDHALDPMSRKERPSESKFGVEPLALGVIVDDRDAPERAAAALPAPLAPEHRDDGRLETFDLRDRPNGLL